MEALALDSGKLLLTQGILGLCVLALSIVVVFLFRMLSESHRLRMEDTKAVIKETTACIVNSSQHIAMSTAASIANANVNEIRARALDSLIVANEKLTETVRDLKEEIRRR